MSTSRVPPFTVTFERAPGGLVTDLWVQPSVSLMVKEEPVTLGHQEHPGCLARASSML